MVLGVAGLINYLIPDVPIEVRDKTLREKFLAKVALHDRIKNEEFGVSGESRDKNGTQL